MDALSQFAGLFLHLDQVLGDVIAQYGAWTYPVVTLIILCETGLVVTPFLPGDSLLFAAGAFAGGGALSLPILFALILPAAIIGDAMNYAIGAFFGAKLLTYHIPGLKPEYIERTRSFYDRYGAKTIVIARFLPIIRTVAPFMAGVGGMHYPTFAMYNVVGALLWVVLFLFGGYFFGMIPAVQEHFTIVILGIIAVSFIPGIIEVLRHRFYSRSAKHTDQA
jgi:membrane-associated protein